MLNGLLIRNLKIGKNKMIKEEERLEKLLKLREVDEEKAIQLFYEWTKIGVFNLHNFKKAVKIIKLCHSCDRD